MSLASDVNSTCPGGYQIIYHSALFSHECISTPLQLSAVIIGFSSVICWVFAQAPQVIKNVRSGEADKAFSKMFLLEWALGDAFNLIGAIFSKQLSFQIWQAAYFCVMDCILSGQYLLARARRALAKKRNPAMLPPPGPRSRTSSTGTMHMFFLCVVAFYPTSVWMSLGSNSQPHNSDMEAVHGGRKLLAVSEDHGGDRSFVVFLPSQSRNALIGYILGSISAFFYVVAGIPQVYKNYKRKSCHGLSKAMFSFAALGNITYALGVLLFSTNHMFLLNKLPWIVGSLGSLGYQFSVLAQFCLYKTGKDTELEEKKSLINNDYSQRVDYTRIEV